MASKIRKLQSGVLLVAYGRSNLIGAPKLWLMYVRIHNNDVKMTRYCYL